LDPSGTGQSYTYTAYKGTNHVITQVRPTDTFEYNTEEASSLAMSFAQTYGLIKGLIKFGEKGEQAANEAMKQLQDRESFRPININDSDRSDRRRVMKSFMFFTEKRDGTIKARNVTDGRKQRDWMARDEAASPTVALEALLLTAVIDAKEHHDVGVVDIPNAFVQTANEKLREDNPVDLMKIRGKLAKMSRKIDPQVYGPYMTEENGVPDIYLEILKALYEMIKSPLLFYRKLRKDLQGIGLEINP
jgi:hypothetical protein